MSRNQSDPPNHHADPQKSSRRSTEKPKSAATLLTLIPKLMGSPYCHAVKYGLEKKKPDQVVNPLRNYPQVINMCMDVFFSPSPSLVSLWQGFPLLGDSSLVPPTQEAVAAEVGLTHDPLRHLSFHGALVGRFQEILATSEEIIRSIDR